MNLLSYERLSYRLSFHGDTPRHGGASDPLVSLGACTLHSQDPCLTLSDAWGVQVHKPDQALVGGSLSLPVSLV